MSVPVDPSTLGEGLPAAAPLHYSTLSVPAVRLDVPVRRALAWAGSFGAGTAAVVALVFTVTSLRDERRQLVDPSLEAALQGSAVLGVAAGIYAAALFLIIVRRRIYRPDRPRRRNRPAVALVAGVIYPALLAGPVALDEVLVSAASQPLIAVVALGYPIGAGFWMGWRSE